MTTKQKEMKLATTATKLHRVVFTLAANINSKTTCSMLDSCVTIVVKLGMCLAELFAAMFSAYLMLSKFI